MQQKRIRGSKPKVFRCSGFGDCNMVFTRSEHLARHSRKHTGEKPFKCIVPHCNKAFSRFDNMMQHTQTHRNLHGITNSPNSSSTTNRRAIIQSKIGPTRSSTRAQTRQQGLILQGPPENESNRFRYNDHNDSRSSSSSLSIKTTTTTTETSHYLGLSSPTSLPSPQSSLSKYEMLSLSSSDEEEEIVPLQVIQPGRRLSVADLCNPEEPTTSHNDVHLTKDEFEALEAFQRFRHTPSVFFAPLRNLAFNNHIRHY